MKATYLKNTCLFFALIIIATSAACSLPVAGPRMKSVTFQTKAPNICFRLSGNKSNKILLSSIEFFDKSSNKKVWDASLTKAHIVVNEEQCIPYGKKFLQENISQSPAKLVFGHVYDVAVSGNLLEKNSKPHRQYSGMFCLTKSESGRPITHTLHNSNGFTCPSQ